MTQMERFHAKYDVDEESGCWIWNAARQADGYGSFGLGARADGVWLAHRFAYHALVGEIPEGMYVLHRCDTPACVNPDHLFLGTQADNVADCAAKGRRNQSRIRKLTPEQRDEIARLYAAGAGSQEAIGRMFGVSQHTVHYIVRRRAA